MAGAAKRAQPAGNSSSPQEGGPNCVCVRICACICVCVHVYVCVSYSESAGNTGVLGKSPTLEMPGKKKPHKFAGAPRQPAQG